MSIISAMGNGRDERLLEPLHTVGNGRVFRGEWASCLWGMGEFPWGMGELFLSSPPVEPLKKSSPL